MDKIERTEERWRKIADELGWKSYIQACELGGPTELWGANPKTLENCLIATFHNKFVEWQIAEIGERFAHDLYDRQKAAMRLAGSLLAVIKVNHARGTFAEADAMQLHEFLAPYEQQLKDLE